MNFDIKTEQLSDDALRHLARGRGRSLHGAGVQAAAARGDRAGRQGRRRRLLATRRSSTRPPSASSSAASSGCARTTASSRSSAATGTSRRSSRSRVSTGSSRSTRRATRRSRSSGPRAAPRPRSAAAPSASRRARAGVSSCWPAAAPAARRRPRATSRTGLKLFSGEVCVAVTCSRRWAGGGSERARISTMRSRADRKQGFKQSTIRDAVPSTRSGQPSPPMPKNLVTGQDAQEVAAYVHSRRTGRGAARRAEGRERRQGDLPGELRELPHAEGGECERPGRARTSIS